MALQSARLRFCCPARRDQMHAKRAWSCFHPSSGMQAGSPVQWALCCVLLPTALLRSWATRCCCRQTAQMAPLLHAPALARRSALDCGRESRPCASVAVPRLPAAACDCLRLPLTVCPRSPTGPANTDYGVAGRTASSLCAHLQ